MENTIFSFIIYSDFGFFKKPDINIDYLSYEIIPKPTLLGLLGSITGLKGYNSMGEVPEYYRVFKPLLIGIQPLKLVNSSNPPLTSNHFKPLKRSIPKTFVKYCNYHGYGSYEEGGILLINEQILIKPVFRIFIERGNVKEDIFNRLKKNIQLQQSHYIPYMGKNDFPLSFIYEGEYNYTKSTYENIKISSLFFTEIILKRGTSPLEEDTTYNIFHNYPYFLEEQQYRYKRAIYSDARFHINPNVFNEHNYKLCELHGKNIFLF